MFESIKRLRDWFDGVGWLPGWLRKIVAGMVQRKKENFEVERKFPISKVEHQKLPSKLRSMGFVFTGQVFMHDRFLPTEVDGDMCRVRDETMDDRTKHLLTLKTWVIVAGNKERKEREDQVTTMVRDTLLDLGQRMTGKALPGFTKDRDLYTRTEEGREVTVSLDMVNGLGEFDGPYMEIELLIANEADVPSARERIYALAEEILGEKRDESKHSYMEMLKISMSKA